MINELLSKYKDQKPKTFGENHMERCYPVSAVIAMLQEQAEQLNKHAVSGRSEQLCQWHDWVKHPSHPKIGAMICRNCRTELA